VNGPYGESRIPMAMRPGSAWQDQVPRREAFEQAHPEVTIAAGGSADWWQARIDREDGGEEYVTRYELSDLLDRLEALFAPP
jgi:hypothetical protein